MSDFDPISQTCDNVYFLGQPTPGLAVVEGNSGSPRKWQEQGGFGLTGATIKFTGVGLAKFDVILKLYDKNDWSAWHAFQSILKPPDPRNPRALSVYHPFLKTIGISECVILDVSLPRLDDYGVGQIVIYCQAFRKPRLTLAKPEGAKATPLDPIDAQLDANRTLLNAQREAAALSDEEFRRRFPNGF